MFNVGSIVGELFLKDQFSGTLKKATDESTKSSAQLQRSLAAVSAAAVAMGAAMLAAAKATANYRDETTKAARRAGMTVEEFSQLRHAAELSGIQFNELAISMSKLASPEAGKRLERLGITMTNLDGTAKSNADIFDEVADKVAQAGTASEKTRIAVAAFGEEGSKMVSMLENGSAGLAEMRQEAIDLGIAFDEEAGKQAELFNDNLDRLGKSIQGVRDSFGQAIIEFINSTGIVEMLTDAIAGVSRWFNNLDQSTKDIIVAIGAIAVAIGALIGAFLIIQQIGPAVGAAMTAAFGPVGIAIMAIVGAIGALVAIIVVAVKNWERFGRAVEPIEQVFASLKEVMGDIWESIKDAIPALKSLTSGNEGKGFVDYLLEGIMIIIKSIGTVVMVVKELIEVIPKLFERIGHLMTGVWEQMKFEAKLFRTDAEEETLASIKRTNETTIKQMSQIIGESSGVVEEQVLKLWDIDLKRTTDAGKDQADAFTTGVENGLEKNKQEVASYWRKLTEDIGSQGLGARGLQGALSLLPKDWQEDMARSFNKVADDAEVSADQIKEAFSQSSAKITDAFGQMASEYVDTLGAIAEATQAQASRTSEIIGTVADLQLQNMQKLHDAEIRAVEEAEAAKIAAVQEGSIERMALINEEFAKRKAQLEDELQKTIAQERAKYEIKLQQLQAESADQEQARLARAVMEADWAAYVERLKQKHNEKLLDEEKSTQAEIRNEEQSTSDKVAQIKEDSNQKKEDLNKKQQEQEKHHAKQLAIIQYGIELFAYEAEKRAAIAGAGFQLASALMSAVKGGAELAALFPPFTIPLGIAFAAMMSGMAITQYNASIATINAQKPLPPPAVFAEQGGVLQGARHAQGGVNVNAEGGEAILSRDLTSRMERMVQRDEEASRSGVMIGQGAIVIYNYGTMDDAAVDKISSQVAERIEQRRF